MRPFPLFEGISDIQYSRAGDFRVRQMSLQSGYDVSVAIVIVLRLNTPTCLRITS